MPLRLAQRVLSALQRHAIAAATTSAAGLDRRGGRQRDAGRRGVDGVWVCEGGVSEKPSEGLKSIYQAMTLGLRDYVEKNGFPGVLIGLSGGVDSAITAAVAVDALGPDRVRCVMMPSPYTSQESLEDAAEAAKLMGVHLDDVGIQPAMSAFEEMLEPIFGDAAADVTEENIQARSRGLILMGISKTPLEIWGLLFTR